MTTRRLAGATTCADCAIRETCTLNRLRSDEPGRIEPVVRERVFHRDDVLLEEERTATFVRFVKLGIVFAYRRGLDGRSRPIGIVNRGATLGIFATFDMPSQATCVALTTVRVCEVPVGALRDLVSCGSGLAALIGRTVTEGFAALTAWSEGMRLPGVVNQLAYVMLLLADANKTQVVQLPSHAALAELLGTRRESIARALHSLESEGGIERHERKRCAVHRERLLARVVRRGAPGSPAALSR